MFRFHNRWKGETFFILASGESMTEQDAQAVRGHGRVITINSTFKLAPWADIHYSSDPDWWLANLDEMRWICQGEFWTGWPWDPVANDVHICPFVQTAKGILREPGYISWGGNSGHCGIGIAYQFGAARIVLLGFDMSGGHWHEPHPEAICKPSNFEMWKRNLRQAAVDLKTYGVEFINCSRSTELTCIKRQGLESLLDNRTLTLLTATGARPKAWSICEQLMARQDFTGFVRWLIVDDGPELQPVTFCRDRWRIEVIRPEPLWSNGENTQARNLLAGLDVIGPDERVVILEDDDYYSPEYLSAVYHWLDEGDLVGESRARYYHVGTQSAHQNTNGRHASLCSTALKGEAIEAFRQVCLHSPKFIDMDLWRSFKGRKKLFDTRLTVGIKGLPGRAGIGAGHTMTGRAEPNKLAEWIGDDVSLYVEKRELIEKPEPFAKLPALFNELILKHAGKRIAVLGGAPSLKADLKRIDADIWISANHWGVEQRPCDYIVAMDEECVINGVNLGQLHRHIRKFSDVPIIGPHHYDDYMLGWWPGSPPKMLSGLVAAWCAWVMGGHPVILAGFDSYAGREDDKAWTFRKHINGEVRQVSGMDRFWPRYDPGEILAEYVPHESISELGKVGDMITIEARKQTKIRGVEFPIGSRLQVARHEVRRLLLHRMVVEV